MKNCSRFDTWEDANAAFHAETDDCEVRRDDAEKFDLPGSKGCAGCEDGNKSCFACWMYTDVKSNNEQIDNTSYYILPCGRQLEEFISWKRLDFAAGSALKYRYRAGMKDGESLAKDSMKEHHYTDFLDRRDNLQRGTSAEAVERLYVEALKWDGKEASR